MFLFRKTINVCTTGFIVVQRDYTSRRVMPDVAAAAARRCVHFRLGQAAFNSGRSF